MQIGIKTVLGDFLNDISILVGQNKVEITRLDIAFLENLLSFTKEETILDYCNDYVIPLKEKIDERDVEFFKEQRNRIPKFFPKEKLDAIEVAMTYPPEGGGLLINEKEQIWEHISIILLLAEEARKIV